jgi:hypothetical protein
MNNTTEDLARTCIVCDKPIDDLRKASGIPAGMGSDLEYEDLAILMHDSCATALSDELDEKDAMAAALSSTMEAMHSSPEMYALTEKIATDEANKQMKKGIN